MLISLPSGSSEDPLSSQSLFVARKAQQDKGPVHAGSIKLCQTTTIQLLRYFGNLPSAAGPEGLSHSSCCCVMGRRVQSTPYPLPNDLGSGTIGNSDAKRTNRPTNLPTTRLYGFNFSKITCGILQTSAQEHKQQHIPSLKSLDRSSSAPAPERPSLGG